MRAPSVLYAGLLLLPLACGDDSSSVDDTDASSSGNAPLCNPGVQLPCTCPDGSDGVQTCAPGGFELSACECDPAAGTDSATDTDDSGMDGMVLIGEGAFGMGCNEELDDCGVYPESRPAHNVTLDDYYIDMTEVTQSAYAECVADGQCDAPPMEFMECAQLSYDPVATPNHPMVCVSWEQAQGYCQWRGARLPTEAEWEKAARGTEGQRFPWGNEDGDCNDAVSADCGANQPEEVGSRSRDVSPYGVMDMAGNVSEWVHDRYDPRHYWNHEPDNDPGDGFSSVRSYRGGNFAGVYDCTVGCLFLDESLLPPVFKRAGVVRDRIQTTVGFRCAASPDGAPSCGNGVREAGEYCDDGNAEDDDGCRSDCSGSGSASLRLDVLGAPADVTNVNGTNRGLTVGRIESKQGSVDALALLGEEGQSPAFSAVPASDLDDYLLGVAASQTGTAFAVGTVFTATQGSNLLIREYSTDFEDFESGDVVIQELQLDPSGGLADEATDVVVDDDGTLLVVGWTLVPGNGLDAFVARIDPEAAAGSEVLWMTTFDNPETDGTERAEAVALAANGDVVVAGRASGPDHSRRWIARYDSNGNELWSNVMPSVAPDEGMGAGVEQFNDVAIDASGNIFAAGGLITSGDFSSVVDASLVAFDSSGAVLWEDTYDGPTPGTDPSRDTYYSVVIDGDRVVVSGAQRAGVFAYSLQASFTADGQRVWEAAAEFDFSVRAMALSDFGYVNVGLDTPTSSFGIVSVTNK